MPKVFDNKTSKVGDELKQDLQSGSKVRMAAAIFSIYGYEALKDELQNIEELKFIFTDPTFIEQEQKSREQRQFELNSNQRKKAIGGSEFEINLKNQLNGRAIAKECRQWIQEKATIKTNVDGGRISPLCIVENSERTNVYQGMEQLTSAGLGYEKDDTLWSPITKMEEHEMTHRFLQEFEDIWNREEYLKDITDEVAAYIANLYQENSPEFLYYMTLYHIFDEFLEDITEDEFANEKTGFKHSQVWNKLYDFQQDAVLSLINKLERYNGCILADSVGLGKTFTALGVMKYYQERNKSVLVLCPKKLGENWLTYCSNYIDNPLQEDRFNYDVLYHTDLSRDKGNSGNGINLERVNWSNYDLIVIDESHNFRNNDSRTDRMTRYDQLLENVIRKGVKSKVLMLSATPVNNRFTDLKNQLDLAYEGRTHEVDERIDPERSIQTILSNAQKVFTEWSKLPAESRTSQELLNRLNSHFDFFKLLDSVTIARSREHIQKYYDMSKLGTFPERLKPLTYQLSITDLPGFEDISEIYNRLTKIDMSVYSPLAYLLPKWREYYAQKYDTQVNEHVNLRQSDREDSLKNLMRVNFLKRLESSVDSFRLTLQRFISQIETTLESIETFEHSGKDLGLEAHQVEDGNSDTFNPEESEFAVGKKVKIHLAHMDTVGWAEDLRRDLRTAQDILARMQRITPEHDTKLSQLKDVITKKQQNPINSGNRKVLIFTAFADTADYLYVHLYDYVTKQLGLNIGKIVGSDDNKSSLHIKSQFNTLLQHFAPQAKELNNVSEEIDVLVATDCIAEGQNLQDCDTLINYDIHWNPVRIIQRFGRIDRIGSPNSKIQLINFWPQLSLDAYIDLKKRVESRMMMVDTAGTGKDNVLTNSSSELDFRKQQLERLQNEVVDIEEMDSGVSITDLGLTDFRMDLINYRDKYGDIDDVPNGMHAVCKQRPDLEVTEGVIYVLKNRNPDVNINDINQLHPFYLVYIKQNGEVASTHLNVKQTLDAMRALSRGYSEPIPEVFEVFNKETDDGNDMSTYSELLNQAIASIIEVKEETDVESLFRSGGTTALKNQIHGLDDFELITFFVIK